MVSSRTMKHRKLFPASTTNDSVVCPDLCDPTCPSFCYPYPDTSLVPPPPPLLPPISTNHSQNISPYVVIVATLLGITFLIVSYYLVIVKNCACCKWFRPRGSQLEDTDESFVDENRGPAIDHPIWYIRTVGLQPSIINSIAVVKYKNGDSLIEGTDCSICLNEFQDDEILRLLPKCNHSFHIPCIDTWLRSHTNCPVCRSGVVNTDTRDRTNEDNQIRDTESTATDGGLSNNQARNAEVDENQRTTDEEIELLQVSIDLQAETLNTRVDFDEHGDSWVIDESDGNNIVHEEMQQMRRSISADSLLVAKIKLAMANLSIDENGHEFEPADYSSSKSTTPTINNDGASASLQQGSVSMKRSSSCGGRSFFSRHSRSLSAVIPL